jgi:hypothetical protein
LAAVAALEQVVTVAPTYRDAAARLTEARQGAEVQAALAQARSTLAAGHHADALALLETVVGRAPGNPEARTLLAQARAAVTPPGRLTRDHEGPAPVVAPPPRADGPSGALPAGARGATNGTAPGAAGAYPRVAGPTPTAAGYRGGSDAPATAAGHRAAATDPPATLGAVAPVAVPAYAEPAESGGSKLKYVLGAGMVALVIAGVVVWQRAPVAALARGSAPAATATVAASAPTAVVPTAVPTPSAASLFPACQSAVEGSAWADAVDACEKVKVADASYPGVADALAAAHVALGKDAVAQGAPLADVVARFDQALAAKPGDAEAEQQRTWAQTYQDGQAALAAESWPVATEKLDQVYTVAPDYRDVVDGGVKRALYRARVGWGDALLAAGSYADARDKCNDALRLVPGDDLAQSCVTKATTALTPPTAVPAPVYVAPAAPAAPVAPAAGRSTTSSAPSTAPSSSAPAARPPASNPAPAAPAAPAAKPTFTPRY